MLTKEQAEKLAKIEGRTFQQVSAEFEREIEARKAAERAALAKPTQKPGKA